MGKSILEKHRDLRKMAGKLGIDDSQYSSYESDRARFGDPGTDGFTMGDLKEKILSTMNTDWNIRESINAGINTGHKNFKDFDNGGIRNIEEAYAVDKAMKKVYKHGLGNGGNWGHSAHGLGGHGDRGGVAALLMKRDREQLMNSMAAPEEEPKKPKTKKPKQVQIPRHMAENMAAVDTFNYGRSSGMTVEGTYDRAKREDFAQKLKDQYVSRLTEYASPHQAGEEPWQKLKAGDDQQDLSAVMPYSAAGIAQI